MTRTTTKPRLVLRGTGKLPVDSRRTRTRPIRPRTLEATDPRWVMAVRVRESLQGACLTAGARRRVIHLGRALGLTDFDCNVIIAIVQDAARRGEDLHGAVDTLALVPQRKPHARCASWRTAVWVACLLAMEAVVIWSAVL